MNRQQYGFTYAIPSMTLELTGLAEQTGEDPGGGYIDPNG